MPRAPPAGSVFATALELRLTTAAWRRRSGDEQRLPPGHRVYARPHAAIRGEPRKGEREYGRDEGHRDHGAKNFADAAGPGGGGGGPRLPPRKIAVGAGFQGREPPGHLGAGPHRAPATRAVDVTGPVDYWSLPPTCTLVREGGPVWRNISCPRLCCSSRAGVGQRTLW